MSPDPLFTGLFTLAGTIAGAVVQTITSRNSQRAQLALEALKRGADSQALRHGDKVKHFREAHQLLSKLQREFSLTTLDILWRSGMTEKEYDQRYETVRSAVDELNLLADLWLPTISTTAELVSREAGTFWFNFKNVLALTAEGKDYQAKQPALSEAHRAATEIGKQVQNAKHALKRLASEGGLQLA